MKYTSIDKLIKNCNFSNTNEFSKLTSLLKLLERVNPCKQEYELNENNIIIFYTLKLNLFNFNNVFPLKACVQVVGMPASICLPGFLGDYKTVKDIIEKRKGLKVVLNSDVPFEKGGLTLSTFIFKNKFFDFNEYLDALRSPYRRRINQALSKRNNLNIRKLNQEDFKQEHYNLYLSVMSRTKNPLEILPIGFFKEYPATIYEFINKETNEIIGFIQLKEFKNKLFFLFGGFRKKDIKIFDIYYNMLLKIIEVGIENNNTEIEFGQTAEESKLKIGCCEKQKYLYVHHSNPILNFIIQSLVPYFSYKPYNIKHHVFKNEEL